MPEAKKPNSTDKLPLLTLRAAVKPGSIDEENRTVTFVASMGTRGLRYSWDIGQYYEELEISDKAIRKERLDAGLPFFKDHARYSIDNQLGIGCEYRIEGNELLIDVRFDTYEDAEQKFQSVKNGILKYVSVGYRVWKYTETDKVGELPVRTAEDWEPMELSLVGVPFDVHAQARSAPEDHKLFDVTISKTRSDELETEALGGEKAMSKEKKPEEQERNIDEPAPQAGPTPEQEEKLRNEAIATERQRTADIMQAVQNAKLERSFAEEHISKGTSIDEVRKLIIDKLADDENTEVRHHSVTSFAPQVEKTIEMRDAITQALQNRTDPGVKLDDNSRQFANMTLIEVSRDVLHAAGINTRGMSKIQIADRAMSTSDLANVFSSLVNKNALDAYRRRGKTFEQLGRRAVANDFREKHSIKLSGMADLVSKNEHGEFKSSYITDEAESYALASYGRYIVFSREMLINDDMDALSKIPQGFGQAANRLESNIVWTMILANPAMADGIDCFHADHGNLGSAAAISVASVGEGRKLMRKQKALNESSSEDYLDLMPKFIVCGPDKEAELDQFLSANLYAATQANVSPDSLRNLTPLVEPRVTGNQWYLFGDYMDADTFEYCYLQGQEGVYIEEEVQFLSGNLKIGARHDFAAKIIDHRNMVKNAGA